MGEVLLFHHALGRTAAIEAFAEELRRAGHVVHVPDLFNGRTFAALDAGVAFAEQIGFPEIVRRGEEAARALPNGLVYIGFSLGVLPAQTLAQTRPGALAAVLIHACLPHHDNGEWPAGVRVQVHGAQADPFFVDEGDLDAARALVAEVDEAELFLYPGRAHLFAERGSESFDETSANLLTQRVDHFLAAVPGPRR